MFSWPFVRRGVPIRAGAGLGALVEGAAGAGDCESIAHLISHELFMPTTATIAICRQLTGAWSMLEASIIVISLLLGSVVGATVCGSGIVEGSAGWLCAIVGAGAADWGWPYVGTGTGV